MLSGLEKAREKGMLKALGIFARGRRSLLKEAGHKRQAFLRAAAAARSGQRQKPPAGPLLERMMMKLYIYDHCPYCVKARMIFGLKGAPLELAALLNDDEETPIKMIGVKMVPILEIPKPGGKPKFLPESLDIIRYIDGRFGGPSVKWGADPWLEAWLQEAGPALYSLCMPRWVKAPLEEFKTQGARDYFQNKKELMTGPFSEAMKNTESLKREMAARLQELEARLQKRRPSDKPEFWGDSLSENDFHLFAFLRSLSIVKDFPLPEKTARCSRLMAQKSGVPLHDSIAL